MFASSLDKPERSQYSICQSSLEPFISNLCTNQEEKKITHKYKHVTGDRATTSSYTTFYSASYLPVTLSIGKDPFCFGCKGGSLDRTLLSGFCTRRLHWIFSDLSSPLGVLLSMVHCWCKQQPKKKWQVPDIRLFLLLLPLPSSAFYFDLLPFTISSPYIYSWFMMRFHPSPTIPLLSKSHSDTTSSSISLYIFLELGVPLSAANTQQPVPNCNWQHLCDKALFFSSNLFRPFKQKSLSQSWLLSWLSPCSHQPAD